MTFITIIVTYIVATIKGAAFIQVNMLFVMEKETVSLFNNHCYHSLSTIRS